MHRSSKMLGVYLLNTVSAGSARNVLRSTISISTPLYCNIDLRLQFCPHLTVVALVSAFVCVRKQDRYSYQFVVGEVVRVVARNEFPVRHDATLNTALRS